MAKVGAKDISILDSAVATSGLKIAIYCSVWTWVSIGCSDLKVAMPIVQNKDRSCFVK